MQKLVFPHATSKHAHLEGDKVWRGKEMYPENMQTRQRDDNKKKFQITICKTKCLRLRLC